MRLAITLSFAVGIASACGGSARTFPLETVDVLDFEEVSIGTTATQAFTVVNGSAAARAVTIELEGDAFSLPARGYTIEPISSLVLPLEFRPTRPETQFAKLRLVVDGAERDVTLVGTGVVTAFEVAPRVVLSPAGILDGVPTARSKGTLRVTNRTSRHGSMRIDVSVEGEGLCLGTFQDGGCEPALPRTVTPGESIFVPVSAQLVAAGDRVWTVKIREEGSPTVLGTSQLSAHAEDVEPCDFNPHEEFVLEHSRKWAIIRHRGRGTCFFAAATFASKFDNQVEISTDTELPMLLDANRITKVHFDAQTLRDGRLGTLTLSGAGSPPVSMQVDLDLYAFPAIRFTAIADFGRVPLGCNPVAVLEMTSICSTPLPIWEDSYPYPWFTARLEYLEDFPQEIPAIGEGSLQLHARFHPIELGSWETEPNLKSTSLWVGPALFRGETVDAGPCGP